MTTDNELMTIQHCGGMWLGVDTNGSPYLGFKCKTLAEALERHFNLRHRGTQVERLMGTVEDINYVVEDDQIRTLQQRFAYQNDAGDILKQAGEP